MANSVAVLSIFFVFFALTLGSVILFISSRFNHVIPYSVVIFTFGMVVSIIADQMILQHRGDTLTLSAEQWIQIDPDVLLCSFLPALLFGEAMHLNFHQIKKAILPASLLAFPGAAFGAYILAIFCYSPGFPVNWSWRMCFIVGAVLSATDPVSVVATLKGLSSSSSSTMKLTYLIVGEALLNDGMALVLFEALITPYYDTAEKIFMYFVRVLFISPLLGLAFGMGCIMFLRLANRRVSHDDLTVQIAVTVGTAYLSFYVAQYVLGVSGVISCCTAGVVLAWLAPPLFIQAHSMSTVWEFLEWIGNTLVFMVAGMIVGRYIVNYATPVEYGCIVIVYLSIFAIRFVTLLICYPLMGYLSSGYSLNDLFFSVFAGLRGSVSLALCIVIQSHVDSSDGDDAMAEGFITFPRDEIRQVIFIVCAVTALTILINGSLSRHFYSMLYRHVNAQTAEADSVILHYVRKRIWQKSEIVLDRLHDILPRHNQVLVVKMCQGVFDRNILELKQILQQQSSGDSMQNKEHDGTNEGDFKLPHHSDSVNRSSYSFNSDHKMSEKSKGEESIETLQNRKFSADSTGLESYAHDGKSMRKKKIPISSTFFSRHSPQATIRKPFYPSPFKASEMSPYPAVGKSHSTRTNAHTGRHTDAHTHMEEGLNDSNIDIEETHGMSSVTPRDVNSRIDQNLITKFRLIFLGVTKKDYMKQINSGRLPSGSVAAIVLLNSIDVGLETVHTDGLQDWDAVKASLTRVSSIEAAGLRFSPINVCRKSIRSISDKDRIFILTSFIDAHKHAHDAVLFYLGEQEGISTPEEKLVVEESVTIVRQAEEWLGKMDPQIVSLNVTRQAASIVLQAADDLVLKFIDEGILTTKAAHGFFDITTAARLQFSNSETVQIPTVCDDVSQDIKVRDVTVENQREKFFSEFSGESLSSAEYGGIRIDFSRGKLFSEKSVHASADDDVTMRTSNILFGIDSKDINKPDTSPQTRRKKNGMGDYMADFILPDRTLKYEDMKIPAFKPRRLCESEKEEDMKVDL